jgi:hypothetical protein
MAVFVLTPIWILLVVGIVIGTAAAKHKRSHYAPAPVGRQPGPFAWATWWVIRWAVCCWLLVMMDKTRPPVSIFLFGGAAVLAAFTARDGIRRWRLGSLPPPPAAPGGAAPPPLPQYHYGPPPMPRRRGRGLSVAALVVGVLIGAGFLVGIVATERRARTVYHERFDGPAFDDDEFRSVAELAMQESQLGLREAKAEVSRGMAEAAQEFRNGMKQVKEAVESAKSRATVKIESTGPETVRKAPPPAPVGPPLVAPPQANGKPVRVEIPPASQPEAKRNGGRDRRTPPAAPAPPKQREPLSGRTISPDKSIEDLAKEPTDDVTSHRYLIEANPKLGTSYDSYQAQMRQLEARAEVLLANHVYAKYRVSAEEWTKPNSNWLYAKGVMRQLHGPDQLELIVTPENVEMVYNFHLGARRTMDLAAIYAGGLMLLGGTAMLLRIGTGLRAKTPIVHKT